MSAKGMAELLRAIATRDAFLAVVAEKLSVSVEAAAKARSKKARTASIEDLRGFASELLLIAAPSAPIAPKTRRIDVIGWLDRTLTSGWMASRGVAVERERAGAAFAPWDEDHLSSIVAELLSNAMKYARGRPVVVRLELGRGRARIVVENRGSWAGPERPVARFDREERRASVPGFGVGVWLSRRLARANGARLAYASDGRTTRAILSFPIEIGRRGAPRFVASLNRG